MTPLYLPLDLVARFWSKVRKTDGCWLWTGAPKGDGYGGCMLGGRFERAHRWSWMLTNGPILEGLFVCHHCDTRLCVRPDHLFLGTASDNGIDASNKLRLPNQKNTACSNGHEFTDTNTSFRVCRRGTRRWRICRTCDRNRALIRDRAKSEALRGPRDPMMTNYDRVIESIRHKAKDAAWAGRSCPHYKREDYTRSARSAYEHVTYSQASEAQRLARGSHENR